jgi:DNA-binding CsgD family transcriptional regulator
VPKEIAARLPMTVWTVRTYMKRAREKLGLHTAAGLVGWAARERLL